MTILGDIIAHGLPSARFAMATSATSAAPVEEPNLSRPDVAEAAYVAVAKVQEGRTQTSHVSDVARVAVATAYGSKSQDSSAELARTQRILSRLEREHIDRLRGAGYRNHVGRVRIADWRQATGLDEFKFWRHLRALEEMGWLIREHGHVRLRESLPPN